MSGVGTNAMMFLLFLVLLVGIMLALGMRKPYVLVLAKRYLRSHTKANLAVIAATCIATLVITGSLIAGDSLSRSITDAAYDNLGEVDEIVTSDRLFNGSIVNRLAENQGLSGVIDSLAPLIYVNGIAESPRTSARTRNANIIGFDTAFLEFGSLESLDGESLDNLPGDNEVYINNALASEIGIEKGDRINITFANLNQILEAIFLGDQKSTNLKVQFEVADIVRNDNLGRFQLNAQRKAPQNVYVSLESLRKVLGVEDKINMILISNTGNEREGLSNCNEVTRILKTALDDVVGHEDAGFSLHENPNKGYVKLEAEDIFFSYEYFQVLSNDPSLTALEASSPILTYFWNTLSFGNRTVPYSTVCAFDSALDSEFGLFTINGTSQEISGNLAENELILNNWTAERLQVEIGNTVSMNYSVMDEFYNIQYLSKDFTVANLIEITGKANDSSLMPSFPGIEGKISAFDWDAPFPLDLTLISTDDENYWHDYSGTPKAFCSLETGSALWQTDIGNITQIRLLPKTGFNLSELKTQAAAVLDREVGASLAGLFIKNVKQDAVESAQGIELFTQMFLAFSAACIVAGAVLIVLLIMLRVESRTIEIGIMRAVGLKKSVISHIFLIEGTILSIIGGLMGTLLGFLFGLFLISGMNTFWSAIVEGSKVSFYSSPDSLVIGFTSGVLICIFTMMFALLYEGRRTVIGALWNLSQPRERKSGVYLSLSLLIVGLAILILPALLGIDFVSEIGLLSVGLAPVIMIFSITGLLQVTKQKHIEGLAGIFIVIYTLILLPIYVDGVPVMELFFVSGFMLLAGFLLMFYHSLMKSERAHRTEPEKSVPKGRRWLFDLARKNAARRPKRTMVTVFLFSLTLFVLVSLTINLQGAIMDVEKAVSDAGGGYEIMGESTNPVFVNLGDQGSRERGGIYSGVFNELEVTQFKTKGDVGGTCSNINRAAKPRIIGANESFFTGNTIVFVSHEELEGDEDNPWFLLQETGEDGDIPAIGDYNTIVWILGLNLGSTVTVLDEAGSEINLKIVGITGNSIFQGSLIIWDENFDTLYPTNNGYQLFLFKSQEDELKPQIAEMESALTRYGFDAYTVESVVVEGILVENTYISIFQVILVLGLIIGTLGFGIVVQRNTMERTREMGILRSIGFSKRTLLTSLLLENSYVLLSAILIGSLSGIIASSVYLVKMHLDVSSWPWLYVGAILIASYVVAMASALTPILRASKMSVSEAIRTVE